MVWPFDKTHIDFHVVPVCFFSILENEIWKVSFSFGCGQFWGVKKLKHRSYSGVVNNGSRKSRVSHR